MPLTLNLQGQIEVNYDSEVGLLIHDFHSLFNSNTLPNSVPLQTTSLRNLNDPDFDLSRSFNVKYNFATDFLLVSSSEDMSISRGLAVIGAGKIFYYLAKILDNQRKIESLLPWSEGRFPQKLKLAG